MKKLGLGIFIGLILIMTGCNNDDDNYSLDDMWVGFGVIQETDSESFNIVMDNGDVLLPVAWDHYHSRDGNTYTDVLNHLRNGERVKVNFTILDDDENGQSEVGTYYVKVNSLKSILMKGIMDITPENSDSIGNDPIHVIDYWMTDSLLTFELRYWGYNEIHFLNLGKQPGEVLEANQPIELQLRHNANGDEESFVKAALVSFSLNELRIEGLDSVQFIVTATDYEGVDFSEEGWFKYGDLEE
jgi:hypothetical protein